MISSLLVTGGVAAAAAAPPKPNIVWIMADDLGWGEPSAYPAGSKHGRISTPNLKKFAASGIRFTDAYAGYTGLYPRAILISPAPPLASKQTSKGNVRASQSALRAGRH